MIESAIKFFSNRVTKEIYESNKIEFTKIEIIELIQKIEHDSIEEISTIQDLIGEV